MRHDAGITLRLWKGNSMDKFPLYPMRFEPIYQYRPWGGRRLASLLAKPLPDDEPIGEAWILSDREDHPSIVADGHFKGYTIRQLLQLAPEEILGKVATFYTRFPLLLKFLDVRTKLSVQVHPSDAYKELLPFGDTGKTEAWVVLQKGPEANIYAGLKPDTTANSLHQALDAGTVEELLPNFVPRIGDSVFIRAGTVHSLRDVVVFEVQENSDVTFRLYDWNQVDPKTKQLRPLQVNQAMACINFEQGEIGPSRIEVEATKPALIEKLIQCDHFGIRRIIGDSPFLAGEHKACRLLVCLQGRGELDYAETKYVFTEGDVLLLPAVVGACLCRPSGPVTMLDISLPEIRRP